jgi:hypothetical protein
MQQPPPFSQLCLCSSLATHTMSCRHPDIRKFDEVRCCLACGEAVFESSPTATTKEIAGSPCQYRRLNYTLGQEIRLIELLPGLRSDDIRCNIVHVNLDDDPEFEAVSYTWATEDGDDTFSKTIYTSSNTTMSVTANCLSALRQLRKNIECTTALDRRRLYRSSKPERT